MREGHRWTRRCQGLLLCGVAACMAPIGAAAAADAESADPAAAAAPAASAASAPEPSKSYAIPFYEIVGFDVLVNLTNRAFSGSDDYKVTLDTIRHNLRSSWVAD